eukprot:Tamp_03531.p1 GENE.Tamp_03531~~Tamp_03531.p1  ORF type:complete len:517 (-),score=45.25 Tamp_03531:371-1921(-)
MKNPPSTLQGLALSAEPRVVPGGHHASADRTMHVRQMHSNIFMSVAILLFAANVPDRHTAGHRPSDDGWRRARKRAPRSVAQWLLPFSHYPRSSLPGWPRRPSRGQTGMRGVHPRRAHQFAPSPPEREQAEWRRLDRVRAGGYVRVQAVSLAWTEEVGGDRAVVSSAEGLAKCRRPGAGPQESWTIESARWHFLKRVCAHRPDLVDFVGAEVRHQQRLEAEGHRSFTWAVLKAAQALMGATAVQGESALAALPCFEAAGRGATVLWGVPAAGPCVILADALSADDRHYLLPMLAQRTDWVVLASRPPSGAWAEELQKHKRVVRTGRHGRGARERGWWQRSCLTTRPLTSDVSCWVHQQAECAPHDLQLLHSALNSKRVRDIWLPCLEGAEASYWLGTEAGLMRAYHFRGQVYSGDGSVLAKSEKGKTKGGLGIYCFRPHTIHSLRFVEPKFTTVATASPAASNALFSAADALSSSSCSAAACSSEQARMDYSAPWSLTLPVGFACVDFAYLFVVFE